MDSMEKKTSKMRLAFSIGEIGDGTAYQSFTFLIFPFYFTVVGLPIWWISLGFILWSIWNSLNDPFFGMLSDKTKSKRGRRIVWMMIAVIPLAIIMVLLFSVPLNADQVQKFTYFMIMLILFDTFYTMFNLNYNSLFSEMFISMKDRSEVGRLRGIFVIISLLIAYILPTLIIDDMTNQHDYPFTQNQYLITSVIAAVVILVSYFIVLKWGVKERPEFKNDAEISPPFTDALRSTLKNKSFLTFIIAAVATWICNGILPTILPLQATYILDIADENSILIGVLLLAGFLVGGASMPLWTKIRQKKGARFTGMVIFVIWALSLIIYVQTTTFVMALFAMLFVGFGLGGSIYFYDQTIAEIIDEDELKFGTRRAGAYYGVISFFIRLSGIINFLVIGIIFNGTEWSTYTPNPGVDVIVGIKILLGVYPVFVLIIGFIGLWLYPIKGEYLNELQQKLTVLRTEKLKKKMKP